MNQRRTIRTPVARNPSCFNLTELNDEDRHQSYLRFRPNAFGRSASLSYAAYFVDQTKTWALETRAQDVVDKATRHKEGADQTQVSRERSLGFYGTDNTSVPGASVDKDDTTPNSK